MERNEALTSAAAPRRELAGSYIDWAAVFGGAVVAAAIAALCTGFGAALGLSTLSAEPGESAVNLWMVVTALWIVISLVLSYMAGGYITGRMRRRLDDAPADEVSARDGINGLVVWGLGMLLTAWMAAGAISGAASAVGTVASAAGSAVGGIAQGAGSAVGGAVSGLAQAAGAAVPEQADDGVLEYLNSRLMRPALQGAGAADGTTSPGAPAADTGDLAAQTGIPCAAVRFPIRIVLS